ncbi:MAG: hypothetical protein ACLFVE_14160 [Chitinispirillaceae bacterium]
MTRMSEKLAIMGCMGQLFGDLRRGQESETPEKYTFVSTLEGGARIVLGTLRAEKTETEISLYDLKNEGFRVHSV